MSWMRGNIGRAGAAHFLRNGGMAKGARGVGLGEIVGGVRGVCASVSETPERSDGGTARARGEEWRERTHTAGEIRSEG